MPIDKCDDCKKPATHGFAGKGKKACKDHKKAGMINLNAKCEDCSSKAVCGYDEPTKCKEHAKFGMEKFGEKCGLCEVAQGMFRASKDSPLFCSKCKQTMLRQEKEEEEEKSDGNEESEEEKGSDQEEECDEEEAEEEAEEEDTNKPKPKPKQKKEEDKKLTLQLYIAFQKDDEHSQPSAADAAKAKKAVEKVIEKEITGTIKHSFGPGFSVKLEKIGKLTENKDKTWIWKCPIVVKIPKKSTNADLRDLTSALQSIDDDGNYPVKVGKHEYLICGKVKM